MRRTFIVGLLTMISMWFVYQTPLVEASSYDTEANIHFKESYDGEAEEDAESDYIPDGTVDPLEPGENAGGDGEELPKTATNMYNLILIGVVLIVIGLIALFLSRRRQQTEQA